VRDPAHVRRLHVFGAEGIVIFPDAAFSRSRYQRHQAVSLAGALDFAQIGIELIAVLRIDKIPHGLAQHFFDAVAEQPGETGIERQESAC